MRRSGRTTCTCSVHTVHMQCMVHMQCICRPPRAAASLGQSAARAALAGHTGRAFDTAAHRAGVSGSTHCEVEPCSCSRRSSAWAALSNACSGTCIGLRLRPTTRSSCQRGRSGSSELSSELGTSSMPVPMPGRSGARRLRASRRLVPHVLLSAGLASHRSFVEATAACCWANVSRAREGGDCGSVCENTAYHFPNYPSASCHDTPTHTHTLRHTNTRTHTHSRTRHAEQPAPAVSLPHR